MAIQKEETIFSDQDGTQHTVRTETVLEGSRKTSSRGRLAMVLVGGLILIVLAIAILKLMGGSEKSQDGAALPSSPTVDNIPGASGSPVYDELVDEENKKKALDDGTSLPTLSDPGETGVIDVTPPLPLPPPESTPEVVPPPEVPVAPVEMPVDQTVYSEPAPRPSPYSDAQYNNMSAALQAYIDSWKVPPVPAQEFSFNGGELVKEGTESAQGQAMTGAGVSAGPLSTSGISAGATQTAASFVRAGTVIPAILLSAVNSDSPGPILAQITSGPLAGTRLIGEFASTDKTLILTFTTISSPNIGTFSVNAVAVDENYSVGMQTDVNNHYFKRYGTLLAAAFLQGFGEAASRVNTTTTPGLLGPVVTQGELTSEQMRKAALGTVGAAVSQELLTRGQVAPTVRLDCRGGCPIGLLFLSDL